MKGLSIRKTTVAKGLRKDFTEILEEDILKEKKINLAKVISRYDDLSEKIKESLMSGSIEYLIPKSVDPAENYKIPEQQDGIRAVMIWNALEPEDEIVPPTKINFVKLKCTGPDDPKLLDLKQQYPDKYDALMKVVFNYGVETPKLDISKYGFTCVAIPKGRETIPEYLKPFIDYPVMEANNMRNGYILLESLGIYVEDVKTVKYKSNIIQI